MIDFFQKIVFFIMSFSKSKIMNKFLFSIRFTCFNRGVSRGYHMISYHMIWYHMISYHKIRHVMIRHDMLWWHMVQKILNIMFFQNCSAMLGMWLGIITGHFEAIKKLKKWKKYVFQKLFIDLWAIIWHHHWLFLARK